MLTTTRNYGFCSSWLPCFECQVKPKSSGRQHNREVGELGVQPQNPQVEMIMELKHTMSSQLLHSRQRGHGYS